MKKFICILTGLLVIVLSCSKDGGMENLSQTGQVLMNSSLAASVIEVYPGVNDTQALIDAFEAASEIGKGAVIKLMAGEFKIGMIEVRDFNGTLMGSGKGVTTITNLKNLVPDDITAMNKKPALLKFIGGNVKLTDFSITMTVLDNNQFMTTMIFSDYTSDYVPDNRYIKVILDNLEITGAEGQDWYFYFSGIAFTNDMNTGDLMLRSYIDVDISNCRISSFFIAVQFYGLKMGRLNIGTGGKNYIENAWQCIGFNENTGILAKMQNNEITLSTPSSVGIDMCPGVGLGFERTSGDLGKYEIRNNEFFNTMNYCIGVFDIWRILNPDDPRFISVMVDHNTFHNWCMATFAMKNGLVSNNVMKGEVSGIDTYGLWVVPGDPLYEYGLGEDNRFLNNKVETEIHWYGFSSDTRSNHVVGDFSKVQFWDEGIENKFNGRTIQNGDKEPPKNNLVQERIENLKRIINH